VELKGEGRGIIREKEKIIIIEVKKRGSKSE